MELPFTFCRPLALITTTVNNSDSPPLTLRPPMSLAIRGPWSLSQESTPDCSVQLLLSAVCLSFPLIRVAVSPPALKTAV
ncbi:hypothetical protein AOLI_G00215440 [Acnodon oligacanthus]